MNTGVYAIWSTVSDHRYVGSTTQSFRKRWAGHRRQLREGRHHCRHLQNAWNKYGPEAFEFRVIFRCDKSECLPREQEWMDRWRSYGFTLYNSSPTAGSSFGVRFSDETKRKIGATHRGRKLTDEHKRKISEGGKGLQRNFSDSHREFLRKVSERTTDIPEVREKIAKTLRGYKHTEEARQNMSAGQRRRIASGYPGSTKGRKLTDEHKAAIGRGQFGRKHSEESKRKRSEKLKGRKPSLATQLAYRAYVEARRRAREEQR